MNYRKNIIIAIAFAILSFNANSQQQKGFEIVGYMEGLKEGEKVTMKLSTWRWQGSDDFTECLKSTDSAYVKDGSFHISGFVPEGPRTYVMEFDQHTAKNQKGKMLYLFIDNNEKITMRSTDIEKIQHANIDHYVTIEGSPTNHSYKCLIPAELLYFQSISRINRWKRKIRDSIGFNEPLLDAIHVMRNEINQALLYNLLDRKTVDPDISTASICLIRDFKHSGNSSIWVNAYEKLDDRTKNSFYGKMLKEYTTLCVGQPFPSFTLPTPEGNILALKDIVAKSKLTIVHFWADQSVDREKYQDELKIFYKKYHDKGLNIVGISSDKYTDLWKEAITRYKIPWYNVSDLKGKDGVVDKVYHEYGIDQFIRNTTNYLIDGQGKILAYDPTDIDLQWYLKKAFGE